MHAISALAPLDQSSRDRILLPHLRMLSEVTGSDRQHPGAGGLPAQDDSQDQHRRHHGATIHLLHVVPVVRSLTPHAIRSAESYVDAFVAQLHADGIDAHGIVRKGSPVEEIVKVAGEYEVDVIVMTTRGRRGLDKLFLGSITEGVMNSCAYPITMINEATAGDVMDERVWTQSSLMAGAIWNKVARGVLTEEQGTAEMQRVIAMGLDNDVLKATYETLKQTGKPAEWLDLDFQRETLEAFMTRAPDGKSSAA